MIGVAIRHASALGLNLRNDSKDASSASKEIRYRVWWALCSVEHMLAVMTGRPTSMSALGTTAPLPLPLEEDSIFGLQMQSSQGIQEFRRQSDQESQGADYAMPTPTSTASSRQMDSPSALNPVTMSWPVSQGQNQAYPLCNAMAFQFYIKLSTLTNEVLNRLYCVGRVSESWAQVQATISYLNAKLENWRQDLPPPFDFTKRQRDQKFATQRLNLGFSYYSTMTIINRPCLCRVDRKIPDESDKAKVFDRETAATCVHAARSVLNLLPNVPNVIGLYRMGPWWCLVHNLMQAAVVLMLELSFRADHMPTEVEEIFDSARKALDWLRSMSSHDEAARRASLLCNELLRQVAPKVGRTPDEVPSFQSPGSRPDQSVEKLQDFQDSEPSGMGSYLGPFSYTPSAPFQPQNFTSYDQILSYDQLPTHLSTSFNDPFQPASDIDRLNFNDYEAPIYFPDQEL